MTGFLFIRSATFHTQTNKPLIVLRFWAPSQWWSVCHWQWWGYTSRSQTPCAQTKSQFCCSSCGRPWWTPVKEKVTVKQIKHIRSIHIRQITALFIILYPAALLRVVFGWSNITGPLLKQDWLTSSNRNSGFWLKPAYLRILGKKWKKRYMFW